jgi:hypothetical protein
MSKRNQVVYPAAFSSRSLKIVKIFKFTSFYLVLLKQNVVCAVFISIIFVRFIDFVHTTRNKIARIIKMSTFYFLFTKSWECWVISKWLFQQQKINCFAVCRLENGELSVRRFCCLRCLTFCCLCVLLNMSTGKFLSSVHVILQKESLLADTCHICFYIIISNKRTWDELLNMIMDFLLDMFFFTFVSFAVYTHKLCAFL